MFEHTMLKKYFYDILKIKKLKKLQGNIYIEREREKL